MAEATRQKEQDQRMVNILDQMQATHTNTTNALAQIQTLQAGHTTAMKGLDTTLDKIHTAIQSPAALAEISRSLQVQTRPVLDPYIEHPSPSQVGQRSTL